MLRWTWTPDEIQALPADGEWGWFYGIVRGHGGRVRLAEIMPPDWWAAFFQWNPKWWVLAVRDVLVTPKRKAVLGMEESDGDV